MSSTRTHEHICLINVSGHASSSAMSISKSLFLKNRNLEAEKLANDANYKNNPLNEQKGRDYWKTKWTI